MPGSAVTGTCVFPPCPLRPGSGGGLEVKEAGGPRHCSGLVAGRKGATRVSSEGWLPSGARRGKCRVALSQAGSVSPECRWP